MIKLIVYFFIFFSLNPFIGLVPIGSDIQVTPFILAAILLIIIIRIHKLKLKMDYLDFILLFISILSFVYINPINGEYIIKKRIAPLMGFLIYFITKHYISLYISPNIIIFSLLFNIISGLTHNLIPEIFFSFAQYFVRELKIIDPHSSIRGVSGFTPEPSFLATAIIVHILFLYFFYKNRRIKSYVFFFLLFLSLYTIYLTKSGTGFFYLIFLIVLISIFDNTKLLIFVILSYLSVLYFYHINYIDLVYMYNNRGFYLLKEFLLEGKIELVFIDASIAQRAANFIIGFISVLIYPFGVGGYGFHRKAIEIAEDFKLVNIFNLDDFAFANFVSAIGLYALEMGLFFIFPFLLFLFLNPCNRKECWLANIFALLLISFSFSLAFPPAWLIFAYFSRGNAMWRFKNVHIRYQRLPR